MCIRDRTKVVEQPVTLSVIVKVTLPLPALPAGVRNGVFNPQLIAVAALPFDNVMANGFPPCVAVTVNLFVLIGSVDT